MSFLKSKHSGYSPDGMRTPYMGGGGGGGPSNNTTVTSNIPEYARPYVTNMFEATQQQLFEGTKNAQGGYDLDSLKGYKPYSTDLNNYFAGFSPLQQQAQYDAGMMQQPGQFALGSGLTGSAGMRSLNAGNQYAQNVTSPGSMQAYMSPYQQNVTDVAKTAALREYQMAQNAQNLGAARQGTYGGARQLLSNTERERNFLSNLSNIQTQGSQSAYDKAIQSQQFGAGLGMQGLGQAMGAGAQLGQLGSAQQASDIARQTQMATMGAQQQGLEQSKINQGIQDYATQQQYPLMQLGFMSNMLRGLPMQAVNTQSYQAQPSTLQQGIGLVGAAGTLLGGGKAEGGTIKMAEGGITGYKYGGAIPEPKLESMADNLSVPQLIERLKDPELTPGERQVFQEALAAKQQMIARSSGIAAAGGGLFDTMGYAGGGILAFAGQGPSLIEDPQFGGDMGLDEDQARLDAIKLQKDVDQYNFLKDASPVAAQRMLEQNPMLRDKVAPAAAPAVSKPAATPTPEIRPAAAPPIDRDNTPSTGIKSLEDQMREQERLMGPNTVGQGLEAKIAERLAGMDKRASQDDRAAMRQAFVRLGTEASPGGFLQAATKSIGTYGDARDAAKKARESMDLELTKMQADIKKGERAEKRGNLDAAAKAFESAENRQLRLAEMQNQLKAAGISASRPGELEKAFALFEKDPAKFEQFIAAKDTNRGNLASATKSILEAKYPNYKLVAMTPPEKRTKEQNEFLQNAYKDAEATAREMMRKGPASAGGKPSGQVDTNNPLLTPPR
jgi:hypothetical protein